MLLYLWRVHGIDYYGGREFNNPAERGRGAARRTLRGPRPSDEELAAAAAEGQAGAAPATGDPEQAEAKPAGGADAEGAADGQQQAEQQAEPQGQEQPGGGEPAAAKDAGEQRQGGGGEVAAQQQGPGRDGRQLQGGSEAAKEYDHRVTGFWRYRIDRGDPLEVPLQRKRVRGR